MKKFLLPLITLSILAGSCKKSSSGDAAANPPYMSSSAGSTWNYEIINNIAGTTSLYTLASTNRDSTIGGKIYHIYTV